MVQTNNSKSAREVFNISRWAIKFSWLTVCFWIAVTVAGILAFGSLKYALFPDITFPVVVVNAQAPLTSALETETKLTKPLEESLKSLEGIENIRSSTYPGQSAVSLLFAVGTNLETSTQETKSALKELKLPAGANYKIIPLNLNESSVISYAIESQSGNLGDLQKLANEKILPAIAKLPGVLKVSLLGAPPKSPPLNPTNATAALTGGANLVRFNGQDVLAFQVIKRGDANTLEVVSRVEQEVQNLRSTLKDVKLTLAATQAEYIRQATKSTIDALIEAIILAVVVIFPFLWNWRATLISALAIPTSLLATFIVMAFFGFNLETITLLALALVIGSVIDDAIIDVENILRHIEEGQSPREAAHLATDEIGLTVVATTATAVAVFLPIGLMGGVVGQFFEPFGITVSASYIASTLVARTLSPVLSIYWLKPAKKTSQRRENKIGVYFTEAYRNLLSWSLNHRKIVIALAILSFIAGIALIPFIPKGFIPKLDRGEFNITYTAPLPKIPDLAALQQLRSRVAGSREQCGLGLCPSGAIAEEQGGNNFPVPSPQSPVPNSQSSIPIPNPLNDSLEVAKKLEAEVRKFPDVETVFTTVGSRGGEPNKGTLYVKLKKDRTIKTAELQDQLRQTLPQLPGVTTSVEDIQFVDTGGEKPLQVALRGNDLKALNQAATTIKDRITKIPGFADVTVTGDTNNADQVFQIERLNQERVAYISANLGQGLTLGDATDKIVAEAKEVLPADITLGLGGDSARQNEVFGSFISTLILSALCIIVVLILLFKSWVDPLVIGVSLPLAVVGAMLSLLLTKSDFGMISLIGFVFLLGLANKNAIVLVDYINQLRQSGLERTEAILKAGPVRLRPIMMTTVSTLLGMLPIALGFGAGSELRSPMAVAIAGGLVTSTILSLIVVPVVYAILDDWFPRKKVTLNR
ncbi:efflux RND transporter permease subunit [Anabaena lutea]|uniref:Efflux RND transporter permease subunit n=1 Tax=Anabaena lutea FACHB-196 TaxID=2692881 RepID=A0ABR8FMY2_9NOST|nr:efflux RND transporter permease subunit [Anabaena lutea]MBD2570071.1 efflux RND transporter permease subunit [Anabaena lutea FACHB-196]